MLFSLLKIQHREKKQGTQGQSHILASYLSRCRVSFLRHVGMGVTYSTNKEKETEQRELDILFVFAVQQCRF